MAEDAANIFEAMGKLALADQRNGTTPSDAPQQSPKLEEAIQDLLSIIGRAIDRTRKLITLIQDPEALSASDDASLSSIGRGLRTITSIAEDFEHAIEQRIVSHIASFAGQTEMEQELLQHLDFALRNVARRTLRVSCGGNIIREAVVACYREFHVPSSTTIFDGYFDALDEPQINGASDSDYESEQHREHENRMPVDDAYAASYETRTEREEQDRADRRKEYERTWIDFWTKVLHGSFESPLLFDPRANPSLKYHLTGFPRYLFRTFDQRSSGRTDDLCVASSASHSSTSSSVDLLSLPPKEAAGLLHSHLDKSLSGEAWERDNLISWSSSLLFAFQYAIWRCEKGPSRKSATKAQKSVKICVIDTRGYRNGQFARDKSLLQAFPQEARGNPEVESFWNLRLRHDNGEFLSQGVLIHAGRSCTVSLQQLARAGLYSLYPEFGEQEEDSHLTDRVKELRDQWSSEHTTSRREIRLAVGIARECFSGFEPLDMALMLLTLKKRKVFPRALSLAERVFGISQRGSTDASDYGPLEVQRYMAIAQRLPDGSGDGRTSVSTPEEDFRILERIFECSEEAT
ncbi:hypothetical protein LIA77_04097 [Sarocladium implicatum]|nr:hypothetical protein LIA77_04097 [Sarocladium implicatum]